MKITMHNKDDIARKIANTAFTLDGKQDELANKMFRVSDALAEIGIAFGRFRTLASLEDVNLPRTNYDAPLGKATDDETDVSYRQALDEVMEVVFA